MNYLTDNLFISILFPNFAIYFLGIIITNILLWISLFHFKTPNGIRKINCIVYIIIHYLFVLILNITDTKKLDVFSESSLYHNEEATALMELSSLIFILWIIFLISYRIILLYLRKEYKPKVKKVVVQKTVKWLPENYEPVDMPDYLFGYPGKRVTVVQTNPNRVIADYSNHLTLEDYQLLLKILKEEKKKKNPVNIQLEKEQIMDMKKEDKRRENEKYTELDMLFRGMR